MNSETVCKIVFWIGAAVFILQAVGYLAPWWFLYDVRVPGNSSYIRADHTELMLPCFFTEATTRTKRGADVPPKAPVASPIIMKPGRDPISTPSPLLKTSGNSKSTSGGELETGRIPTMTNVGEAISNMDPYTDNDHVMTISAGFWYGSACVRTVQSEQTADYNSTMWCTLYWRTERVRKMRIGSLFELRIEASLGCGLSLLSLLVASTVCCSGRYHGKRAIVSMTTMFLSGAVMTIPIVHAIIQHHKQTMSSRSRDIFDHFSVIICAAGSVLAILSTLILSLVKCCNPSSDNNAYTLEWSAEGKVASRQETIKLPAQRLSASNITLPPLTQTAAEKVPNEADSESGYSDIRDDVTLSALDDFEHIRGDIVDNDNLDDNVV